MKNQLNTRLDKLAADIEAAAARLDLADKQQQLEALENNVATPEIWHNPAYAKEQTKKLASLKAMVQPWLTLRIQVNDLIELLEIADDELLTEFDGQVVSLEKEYVQLRQQLMFNGRYDAGDAILRLSAGAGGDDAQDFTEMLERMYLRWALQPCIDFNALLRTLRLCQSDAQSPTFSMLLSIR